MSHRVGGGAYILATSISYLSVLHTIRNRYAQHSIYTYSGIVLIAVNPFQRVTLYGPEIIQAYSGRKRGELEPHLFAIAEDAYTAMRKEGMGQTIIVSGERYVGYTVFPPSYSHFYLVVLVKLSRLDPAYLYIIPQFIHPL